MLQEYSWASASCFVGRTGKVSQEKVKVDLSLKQREKEGGGGIQTEGTGRREPGA